MNKVILFSPLGGMDPLSKDGRDGSMIHICRHYKPDVVFLYMSKEIIENHKKDDRYLYTLKELLKKQGKKLKLIEHYDSSSLKTQMDVSENQVNCILIQRPELTEVQEFNYFYEEFGSIIKSIYSNKDDSDRLLLNISSGTPAMKSGLLVLAKIGEFDCENIQVSTPMREMNNKVFDYDVQVLWSENKEENYASRAKEEPCPSLLSMKYKEVMKKHIEKYDYSAALEIATSVEMISKTKDYVELLKMANYRLQLNYDEAIKIADGYKLNIFDIKEGEKRVCFEYALNLDIKLRKKEYADFIRAITPLIVSLFEKIVNFKLGIDINNFCQNDEWGNRVWDQGKLANHPEIKKALRGKFPEFRGKYVLSIHLINMFYAWLPRSEDVLWLTIRRLRKVEEKVRNMAAHNMISVSDDDIKEELGFKTQDIMNDIKTCFYYTDVGVKREFWDSYTRMNREIIKRI